MASNASLTKEQIARIAAHGPARELPEEFLLLIVATDEMLTEGTLTDSTQQHLLDVFGTTTTRRYIATIAWFSLLSLFLNATRVPRETTDKIGARTSPLK